MLALFALAFTLALSGLLFLFSGDLLKQPLTLLEKPHLVFVAAGAGQFDLCLNRAALVAFFEFRQPFLFAAELH